MIKSMTGFAALTREETDATISVTIRSVNHRYLDLQLRVPQSFSGIEPRIRGLVQRHVARGRVEVAVSLQLRQQPVVDIDLNDRLLAALSGVLDRARASGLIDGQLTPGDLLRFPQAVAVRELPPELDAGQIEAVELAVESAVRATLEDLDGMRRREGDLLRADLDARQAEVSGTVERLVEIAGRGRTELRARLQEHVDALVGDLTVDRAAIAQEVVRFAARSDISEEVVRFRAHVAQWAALSDSPEPCGRKLDFLLQEMNREINTIGSKADGESVPELVIHVKAELEKMREQVQNVE
ncbi:MAG: YicC/YloC family endoribonuclease [Acidobacteriota bacterium]